MIALAAGWVVLITLGGVAAGLALLAYAFWFIRGMLRDAANILD